MRLKIRGLQVPLREPLQVNGKWEGREGRPRALDLNVSFLNEMGAPKDQGTREITNHGTGLDHLRTDLPL